jgi:hypothetical protein
MPIERTNCVMCRGELETLYTVPNTPATCAPTTMPPETDHVHDMIVGHCTRCGCVQLKTLNDPELLYSQSHNETADTPTWRDHHRAFAEFVRAQGVQSLTEIGGSSGSLYRHLPPDLSYTCMDLCEPSNPAPFVRANCETYDFSGTDCICMSHVFEHLFNPREFVEHISPFVTTVILSIPNMTHLLSLGSLSIVFNEHTYFVDAEWMTWLFARCGYTLRSSLNFRTHSLFLCFEKTSEAVELPIVPRVEIGKTMKTIHAEMMSRCSNLSIPEGSFIAPAGHMGQLLYSLARPSSLRGFLDNDRSKQGKRVYGTPHTVAPMQALAGLDRPTVYVNAGVYTDEICAQLQGINNSAILYRV